MRYRFVSSSQISLTQNAEMSEAKFKIIKNLLNHEGAFRGMPGRSSTIYLHTSVVDSFIKVWHNLFENTNKHQIFNFNLQIIEQCFDMCIVYAESRTVKEHELLHAYIRDAQYSFPWEGNPTLFINAESFHIMQKFIKNHKICGHILKIVDKPAVSLANNEIIKVVTFSRSVLATLDIAKNFRHYLKAIKYFPEMYYYMIFAFAWHQPDKLNHFKIPLYNEFLRVAPIILYNLGTLNYFNQLNIFDLLHMRLALCDFRDPHSSSLLKYEIDFMIKRKLAKTVKDGHLDLDQYAIDVNYVPADLLIAYFTYEFQNEFISINASIDSILDLPGPKLFTNESIIKLTDEENVLSILKEKDNINHIVDSSKYDRMNFSLFLDLIQCRNKKSITLDADLEWIHDKCEPITDLPFEMEQFKVYLCGSNASNFIEGFVTSLKTVTFISKYIYLIIQSDMNDYRVFDHLNVDAIEFRGIKINSNMLEGLLDCQIISIIVIIDCTFENSSNNWALVNSLREMRRFEVREEEGTWQSIFDFVSGEIFKSNLEQFQFNQFIYIGTVGIGGKTFFLDKINSKLEVRRTNNNEILDLFYMKSGVMPDDKSDFDFYE